MMGKRFVATLGVIVVLSACGSPPSDEATNVIALAADRMRDAGSMSFTIDMTMSGGEFSADVSGSGAVDIENGLMHMEMEMPGVPGVGDGRFEMRMIDTFMYMKMPNMPGSGFPSGSWMKFDLAEVAGSDPFSSSDPTAYADFLRGVSDEVETVGREEIRGHATTHYRAEVDLEKAIDALPPKQRKTAGEQIATLRDQFGTTSMPIEVWIDDDGLLWREVIDTELGSVGRMSMTFDVVEYGVAVDVVAPPANQVIDAPTGVGGMTGSSTP